MKFVIDYKISVIKVKGDVFNKAGLYENVDYRLITIYVLLYKILQSFPQPYWKENQ